MTTLARVRGWLMAVLAFGLAGTFIELLLLAHYEEVWQLSPLVLIALAIGMAWQHARPRAASVRALRLLMILFVVSGIVGTALHMRGAAEFQLEIDPSLPRWELFKKVMRAQAPPALAPGVMMQLGLVGLVALYRHPTLKGSDTGRLS
jgi:hypothetical protein